MRVGPLLTKHPAATNRRCAPPPTTHRTLLPPTIMSSHAQVADIYQASSKLAQFPFEPYWPEAKLKICITGAGGFIARWGGGNARGSARG